MDMETEEATAANMEKGKDQAHTDSRNRIEPTHMESHSPDFNSLAGVSSTSAVQSIASYLRLSLKNLREENIRLTEENRRLQESFDAKVKEKLNSLYMMNLPPPSIEKAFLKLIKVKQLKVMQKMEEMLNMEKQMSQAYDDHCKAAFGQHDKQHHGEKQSLGYDDLTTMNHVELTNTIISSKEKTVSNEIEAKRLTLQLKLEDKQHEDDLNSIRESINTLEDVLREASKIVQDLQFERAHRRRVGFPTRF